MATLPVRNAANLLVVARRDSWNSSAALTRFACAKQEVVAWTAGDRSRLENRVRDRLLQGRELDRAFCQSLPDSLWFLGVRDTPSGSVQLVTPFSPGLPLWVHVTSTELRIGSHLPDVVTNPELDPSAIEDLLAGVGRPHLVRGVEQAPTGSVIQWQAGQEAYSASDWVPPAPSDPPSQYAEACEEFNYLLDTAVSHAWPAGGPLGVEMSGGLDSTAIAAAALQQGEPVHSYTWRPGAEARRSKSLPTRLDEWPQAQLMGEHYPQLIQHEVTNVPAVDPLRCFLDVLPTLGQLPFHIVNLPVILQTRRDFHEIGGSMLLHGGRGNAVFSPHRPEVWWQLLRRRHLAQFGRLARRRNQQLDANWGSTVRMAWRNRNRGRSSVEPGNRPYLTDELLGQGVALRLAQRSNTWLDAGARWEYWIRQGSAFALPHAFDGLDIVRTDPFGSWRIVNYVSSLPAQFWIYHGRGRDFARDSQRTRLPNQIVETTEVGVQSWDHVQLLPHAQDLYRNCLVEMSQSALVAELLNLPALTQMLDPWPETPNLAEYRRWRSRVLPALTLGMYVRWVERGMPAERAT